MKPHIRKINGMWHCCRIPLMGWRAAVGVGYTPAQAYQDWVKESQRHE